MTLLRFSSFNSLALSLLATFSILIAAVQAEPEETTSLAEGSGYAELDQVVRAYLGKEAAIDEKFAPQIERAQQSYLIALKALLDKAEVSGKVEDADKIRSEVERWQRESLNTSVSDSQNAPVKKLWKTLGEEMRQAANSSAPERNILRAEYARSLAELEKGFVAKNEPAAVAAVRGARAFAVLRSAIEKEQLAYVGSDERSSGWKDIAEEGGYIVGFDVGTRTWTDKPVLGRFKPIYRTAAGIRDGRKDYGIAPSARRVVAKEGYAVGGLLIRDREAGDGRKVIGCVQVDFMKIRPDGMGLDPKDTYSSGWLGGEGGAKPREVSTKGRFIVGIRCKSGEVTDAITLISQK